MLVNGCRLFRRFRLLRNSTQMRSWFRAIKPGVRVLAVLVNGRKLSLRFGLLRNSAQMRF